MKRSFVCRVSGVSGGDDSRSSEQLKKELKAVISKATGVMPEEVRVYIHQDVQFTDESDGIFCEVIVPESSLTSPEKLEEILLDYLDINAQAYAHY